ncbi:MAG: hypothetical protein NT166_17060 [Candidatus Aminicenantes bacterium]|nr:hypothetical protein [Candidatus Aminicenantes bacterium]
MSGASTVEFHIKAKEGARNAFTLEVFQRGGSLLEDMGGGKPPLLLYWAFPNGGITIP